PSIPRGNPAAGPLLPPQSRCVSEVHRRQEKVRSSGKGYLPKLLNVKRQISGGALGVIRTLAFENPGETLFELT
ncbi:MAG TPA: hypothetical protein VHA33_15520, partial [Candidatus Angelobacter sp.]|nr:hypothetical protein [Candidatus Angelobacter sp.]